MNSNLDRMMLASFVVFPLSAFRNCASHKCEDYAGNEFTRLCRSDGSDRVI